jgi:hypothetical protein
MAVVLQFDLGQLAWTIWDTNAELFEDSAFHGTEAEKKEIGVDNILWKETH